jgi:hypothetical protein
MAQFEDLYDKLLSDKTFREFLQSDPAAALTSVGIAPTPEILLKVKGIIDAITDLGEALDGDLKICVT